MIEKVLCCSRGGLPVEWLGERVAIRMNLEEFTGGIKKDAVLFEDRVIAESNTDLKQVIPYILVREDEHGAFLTYQRNGTEGRLHGLESAGIGGHINQNDEGVSFLSTVEKGLTRELREELMVSEVRKRDLTFLGIINEEITAVGNVHLGVVFLYRLESGEIFTPDEELLHYRFSSIDSMRKDIERFELWTRLAMELL